MRLTYDLWLAKLRTADADCPPSPVEAEVFSPPFEPDAEPIGGTVRFVAPGDSLQSVIDASASGDRVYVMEGIYPLTANIIPKLGVSIYGGFKSDNPTWATRQPFQNPSVFDAQMTDVKLVNAVNFADGQIIDGLTIINVHSGVTNGTGFVNTTSTNKMYLKHCVVKNGATTWNNRGGGAFYYADSVNCMAQNCTSKNNFSSAFTGGRCHQCYAIDCWGGMGTFYASANTDCVAINYSGRTSAFNGGSSSRCRAVNCIGENGGGFNGGTVENCTAFNCTAYARGGGFYRNDANAFQKCIAIGCKTLPTSSGNGGGFVGNANNCMAINCIAYDRGSGYSGGKYVNCMAINCSSSDVFYTSGAIINCLAANCTGGTVFYFSSVSTATCCYNNVTINCYSAIGNPALATTIFVNTGTLKIYNCFLNGMVYVNTGAAADKRNTIEFGTGGDYSVDDCKFANPRFLQNIGQLALGIGVENLFADGGFGDFHFASNSILTNGGYWEDGVTPAMDFDGIERPIGNISIGPFEAAMQSYSLEKPRLELSHRDAFGNAVSGEFPPVDPSDFETQEE